MKWITTAICAVIGISVQAPSADASQRLVERVTRAQAAFVGASDQAQSRQARGASSKTRTALAQYWNNWSDWSNWPNY